MRMSIGFSLVVIVTFFGLLLMGAYAGQLMARPVLGAIPLSFVLGVCFIVGAFGLTAIYAARANAVGDDA